MLDWQCLLHYPARCIGQVDEDLPPIAGMGVSLEVDTMISEGDKVVAMCRMTGVHQADFMGVAASGQTINVGTAEQFRFEDGKVVEH